jgi:hypothetical protein
MKRILPVAVVMILIYSVGVRLSGQQGQQQSECAVVSQALRSAQLITPGAKRQEVEKDFTQDGGVSFRTSTIYVSRMCPMLKIKIDFVPTAKAPGPMPNSEDTVSQVSRMYVEWPVRD